jgi:iron complex transport system substrate-binding protein
MRLMRHSTGKPAVAAILAAVCLIAAGCSSSSTESRTSKDSDALLSSVDTTFGTVDVPKPKDGRLRVVALGWSDAETALALGVKPVAVYDWLGFGEKAKGVGPWATKLFGSETPVVMKNVNQSINYEQIQSLEPDLILNVSSAGDKKQFERLSSIAPTVYAPKGANPYGLGWRAETSTVSKALGKDAEGAKLVDGIDAQIAAAKTAHPEFAGLTAVAGAKAGNAYGATLPGDPRWDLLASLGFKQPPAIPALGRQTSFSAVIPAEKITALDADVTVLFAIGFTLDQLKADPLVRSLPVVKDGRAVFLEPTGDIATAFSVGSVLSLPVALQKLVPLLADAAAKVKR